MIMEKWLETVYSDGSPYFVTNNNPKKGEPVAIFIRMSEMAPVKAVELMYRRNGQVMKKSMKKDKLVYGLQYFRQVAISYDRVLKYTFRIITDTEIYYYDQRGIVKYQVDDTYAFQVVYDWMECGWVNKSCVYQVIPDRFYKGEFQGNVKDRTYQYHGVDTIEMQDWNSPVLYYKDGGCADFYGGNLYGLINKLDYLEDLGVGAIYMTPIFKSLSNHKYDTVDYYEIDPYLGGNEALKELTAKAHEKGIKVILDIALNHTGDDAIWFEQALQHRQEREYYFFKENGEYLAWNGILIYPKLNYNSERLREIVYRDRDAILKYWMKPPYNVDGFRFDTANETANYGDMSFHLDFWRELCSELRNEKPDTWLIGEEWHDASMYLQGDMWNGSMNYFGCARPVRQFIGQADLIDISYNGYRNSGFSAYELIHQITHFNAKIPWQVRQMQYNLIDSHDSPRLHNDSRLSSKMRECAILLQFALEGAFSIYYGDELSIDGRGDVAEGFRYPMPWDKEDREDGINTLYRKLNYLKRQEKAFQDGGLKFIEINAEILGVARFVEDKVFLIVCSKSDALHNIGISLDAFTNRPPASMETIWGNAASVHIENNICCIDMKLQDTFLIKICL